jgi:hypothetical protein
LKCARRAEMTSYSLAFPIDFHDYASEWEAKGWFSGATLVLSEKRYKLSFYDPVRLNQEIAAELQKQAVFAEPNLLVIPSVTRSNIEKAVDYLVESGNLGWLIPQSQ